MNKLKNINLDLFKYKIIVLSYYLLSFTFLSILFKEEYSKLKLYVRTLVFFKLYFIYIFLLFINI